MVKNPNFLNDSTTYAADKIFFKLLKVAKKELDDFGDIAHHMFYVESVTPNKNSIYIDIDSKTYKELGQLLYVFLRWWVSGDADEDERVIISADPSNIAMIRELVFAIERLEEKGIMNPCKMIRKRLDYIMEVIKPLLDHIHYEMSYEAHNFALLQALRGIK